MSYKIIDLYPEYMKGFEYVKKTAETIEWFINTYKTECNIFLGETHFERWSPMYDNAVKSPEYNILSGDEIVAALLTTDKLMTMDVLKKYLCCFIDEERFTVVFDAENMKITVKTLDDEGRIEKIRNYIRNFVPCNMELEILNVDNFGE